MCIQQTHTHTHTNDRSGLALSVAPQYAFNVHVQHMFCCIVVVHACMSFTPVCGISITANTVDGQFAFGDCGIAYYYFGNRNPHEHRLDDGGGESVSGRLATAHSNIRDEKGRTGR